MKNYSLWRHEKWKQALISAESSADNALFRNEFDTFQYKIRGEYEMKLCVYREKMGIT